MTLSPVKVAISLPLSRSQSRGVRSLEAETARQPPGVIATAMTGPVWPSSGRIVWPLSRSQSRSVPSLEFMCSHRSPRAAGSEGRPWHRPSRRAISRRLKPLRGAETCIRARSDLSTAHPVRCLLRMSCTAPLDNHFPFPFGTRRTCGGSSPFVLLWISEWQGCDLRRACFQSLRRHIFNGLFTGEEVSNWSTTIVVMAAFDSGQLASLRSLTEVFGPMCLIRELLDQLLENRGLAIADRVLHRFAVMLCFAFSLMRRM